MNCGMFIRDMNVIFERLSEGLESGLKVRLEALKNRLAELYVENKVKINHSVMELVLVKHLLGRAMRVMLNGV